MRFLFFLGTQYGPLFVPTLDGDTFEGPLQLSPKINRLFQKMEGNEDRVPRSGDETEVMSNPKGHSSGSVPQIVRLTNNS